MNLNRIETFTDKNNPEMVYSWIPSIRFGVNDSTVYTSPYFRLRIGKKPLYRYQ
jgi:hypothetical protein